MIVESPRPITSEDLAKFEPIACLECNRSGTFAQTLAERGKFYIPGFDSSFGNLFSIECPQCSAKTIQWNNGEYILSDEGRGLWPDVVESILWDEQSEGCGICTLSERYKVAERDVAYTLRQAGRI